MATRSWKLAWAACRSSVPICPLSRALANDWATYFSPDEDPERIAAMIQARLEDDPVYQMRAHVRAEYTWGAIYNRLLAPLLETT